MGKICINANKNLHLFLTGIKSRIAAYGVNFTQVSNWVHMHRFTYVNKFAYLQMSTHVCKSDKSMCTWPTELNSEKSRISALKSAARFLCSLYLKGGCDSIFFL